MWFYAVGSVLRKKWDKNDKIDTVFVVHLYFKLYFMLLCQFKTFLRSLLFICILASDVIDK